MLVVLQLELNGFAADLRHIVHFESLSAALRRGFDSTISRRVPLTHLQLQGCAALDLDALQLLLDAVPTIQALDISRSVNIDDAAVKTLAQYEPGPADAAVHEVMESIQLEVSHFSLRSCAWLGPHRAIDVLCQNVSYTCFFFHVVPLLESCTFRLFFHLNYSGDICTPRTEFNIMRC